MKTAISIDDALLHDADRTAQRLGLSRSGLFARAVGDFLERQRQEDMRQRLNEVYATAERAEKRLLQGMKAKVRKVVAERW